MTEPSNEDQISTEDETSPETTEQGSAQPEVEPEVSEHIANLLKTQNRTPGSGVFEGGVAPVGGNEAGVEPREGQTQEQLDQARAAQNAEVATAHAADKAERDAVIEQQRRDIQRLPQAGGETIVDPEPVKEAADVAELADIADVVRRTPGSGVFGQEPVARDPSWDGFDEVELAAFRSLSKEELRALEFVAFDEAQERLKVTGNRLARARVELEDAQSAHSDALAESCRVKPVLTLAEINRIQQRVNQREQKNRQAATNYAGSRGLEITAPRVSGQGRAPIRPLPDESGK